MLTRQGKRRPSSRLTDLLHDQGLDAYARWGDCEPLVRELARDLPDFDSVWLDALVQRQLLTPWQAAQLQLEQPGRLIVGGRLLREPLGRQTFLAYDPAARALQVLRQVAVTGERISGLLDAVQRAGARPPRNVVLPTIADGQKSANNAWLATAWIPGWDFSELLVRGGRLPWGAVAEAGRELLQALAWFEAAGLLHGEVVLRNLRLTPAGRIVLVDPFSRRLGELRPTAGQPLSLRQCEGFAPELLGSTRPADVRSELHAAGCLLWQLLTARPPVAAADPVRRMLWLRDHDLPDVRGLVPDCPEWMARLLVSMTRRLPELRPARILELAHAWTAAAPAGLGSLRRIARELPDRRQRQAAARIPRIRRGTSFKRLSVLLAGCALAAVGTLSWLRPELLTLALRRIPESRITAALPAAGETELEALRRRSASPAPLPAPDSSGVIRLEAGQVWLADTLRVRGPLRIESAGRGCAVILVRPDRPWILQAETVTLQGLQIQQQGSGGTVDTGAKPATQLAAIQSRSLTLEDCVVQSPSAADEFSGVSWYEPPGFRGGEIAVRHSVFAGGGYGLAMNQPPRLLALQNVLFACRGGGMLCEVADAERTAWTAQLSHVTQRFGFSVADFVVHDGGRDGPQQLVAELICEESAFEPRMAVVRVRPAEGWTSAAMQVRLSAEPDSGGIPAVVPPETEPAVYIDRNLGQPAALPEAQVPNPQLLYADLEFADGGSGLWGAAELVDFEGPRLSESMPGCDVQSLPLLVRPE
ncbi:MAG: Serine/threonine-protein kinase PrkC [Planctomycetota bacterium]